jgi:hypothetical protein
MIMGDYSTENAGDVTFSQLHSGATLIDAPPDVVVERYHRDAASVTGTATASRNATSVWIARPSGDNPKAAEMVRIQLDQPGVPVPFRLESTS